MTEAAPGRRAVAAVVVAAGSGTRMARSRPSEGGAAHSVARSRPKQYLQLAGRPILTHTIDRFESTPAVDLIVLVVPPGDERVCAEEFIRPFGFHKVAAIVAGGAERQASVAHGLAALPDNVEWVAVHDGVRPCVTPEQITAVIDAAGEADGAILAVPLHDTPKQVGPDAVIQSTLPRSQIWLAQTPQVFRRTALWEAHARAVADGVIGTDDAALMERLGARVVVVEGASANIKITTPEDLPVAERWLSSRGIAAAGRSL
ncbi:MAG TPA: 2-C-methyl-D-erythritol 4-phosphate cytidylyltransferase [Nitrospiria bacterium]|nr:2-C-methyl-D-erythritol 4-phosphate cytidylyltransferase [Nitrospiria bacterium]